LASRVGDVESPTDVQDRCAFGGGTQGHAVEPPLVASTAFSCSFGDIERDGRASPLELVAKVGPASRKTFDNSVRKCEEFNCCPVDVKSLMIEGGHG